MLQSGGPVKDSDNRATAIICLYIGTGRYLQVRMYQKNKRYVQMVAHMIFYGIYISHDAHA